MLNQETLAIITILLFLLVVEYSMIALCHYPPVVRHWDH